MTEMVLTLFQVEDGLFVRRFDILFRFGRLFPLVVGGLYGLFPYRFFGTAESQSQKAGENSGRKPFQPLTELFCGCVVCLHCRVFLS